MKITNCPLISRCMPVIELARWAGCAADPTNDPHSGGFFGGVRGLASGDYDTRQQQLQEERDDS
jgi:hypothetical protein